MKKSETMTNDNAKAGATAHEPYATVEAGLIELCDQTAAHGGKIGRECEYCAVHAASAAAGYAHLGYSHTAFLVRHFGLDEQAGWSIMSGFDGRAWGDPKRRDEQWVAVGLRLRERYETPQVAP